MPLPEPANAPITFPALELLAEVPKATLHRIIRGNAHIEIVQGQAVICPVDHDAMTWITKTLNYLGVPVATWLPR